MEAPPAAPTRWRVAKIRTVGWLLLLLDRLPSPVVATDAYVRFRRYFSRQPQRFEPYPPSFPGLGTGIWEGRKIATRETELVIEGYPGSANSFTSNCIREQLPVDFRLESHFHQTMQLRRALALRVPAVVLVRDPLSACTSLKSKEPAFQDVFLLTQWILFYGWVRRRSGDLLVLFFDEVTADVDLVRRACPALRRIVPDPIPAVPSLTRPSVIRKSLDLERASTRWLIRRAERLYRALRAERGELNTSCNAAAPHSS